MIMEADYLEMSRVKRCILDGANFSQEAGEGPRTRLALEDAGFGRGNSGCRDVCEVSSAIMIHRLIGR